MNIKEIIKNENLDGFLLGLGLASSVFLGYLTFSDMKEKDYRILNYKDGFRNIQEMFYLKDNYIDSVMKQNDNYIIYYKKYMESDKE